MTSRASWLTRLLWRAVCQQVGSFVPPRAVLPPACAWETGWASIRRQTGSPSLGSKTGKKKEAKLAWQVPIVTIHSSKTKARTQPAALLLACGSQGSLLSPCSVQGSRRPEYSRCWGPQHTPTLGGGPCAPLTHSQHPLCTPCGRTISHHMRPAALLG